MLLNKNAKNHQNEILKKKIAFDSDKITALWITKI